MKRRSGNLGWDVKTQRRARMRFDRKRRQVPGPGKFAIAHRDIARQRHDESIRHRIDERRTLLDGPYLLVVQIGKCRRRHAAQPIRQSAASRDRPRQAVVQGGIAAKHDAHDLL